MHVGSHCPSPARRCAGLAFGGAHEHEAFQPRVMLDTFLAWVRGYGLTAVTIFKQQVLPISEKQVHFLQTPEMDRRRLLAGPRMPFS
jgi:hypothetical protein